MVSKKLKYMLSLSLCALPVILYSTSSVEAAPLKKGESLELKSVSKKNNENAMLLRLIDENTSSSRLSDFSSSDYHIQITDLLVSDINRLFDSSLKGDVSVPFVSISSKYASSDNLLFSNVYFPTTSKLNDDASFKHKLRLESPYLLSDSFNGVSDLDLDGDLLDFSNDLEKNNEKISALMYLFLDKGVNLDTQLYISSYDDLNYEDTLKKDYIISLLTLDDYLQTGFYQDLLEDKTISDLVDQKKKDVDAFIKEYKTISEDIYKAPTIKERGDGSILKEGDTVFATATLNVKTNDHQYFNTGFSKMNAQGFDVTDTVKVLNNGRNVWSLSNVSSKLLDDGTYDYTYTFKTDNDSYKRWARENKDHKLLLEFIPSVSFVSLDMPGYDVLSSNDFSESVFQSKQLTNGKSFYNDKLTLSLDVEDKPLLSGITSGQYLEHHLFNNAYALDNELVKQFYPSISEDVPYDFSLYYVTNTDEDKVSDLSPFDLDPGAIFSGFLFEKALSGRLDDYTRENEVTFDSNSLMGPALADDILKYNASFLNFYFTSYYDMKDSNKQGIYPYEAFDDESLDIPYKDFYYWLFDNYTLEVKSLMDQYYFDDSYESIQDKMMSLKLSMIRLVVDHLDELKEQSFANDSNYMMFIFSLESNKEFIKKDNVLKMYDKMYEKAISDAKNGYNRSDEIKNSDYKFELIEQSGLIHKDGKVIFDFKIKADTDKYGSGEIKFENMDEFSDWDIDVKKTDDGYHYHFSISESDFKKWDHHNNFTVKLHRDYKVPYTQNTFILYNQAKSFKSESIEVLTLPMRYQNMSSKVWVGFINEKPEEPVYPPVEPPENPPEDSPYYPPEDVPEKPKEDKPIVVEKDPSKPTSPPNIIIEEPELKTESPKEVPAKENINPQVQESVSQSSMPQLGFKNDNVIWYLSGSVVIGLFGFIYYLKKRHKLS